MEITWTNKWNKEHQTLIFQFFINKSSVLMFFVLFLHVVFNISNSNMWIAKYLAWASCAELTWKNSWKRSEQLTSSSKFSPKKMKTMAQITMVIIMIIRHDSKTTVDPDVRLFPVPAGGAKRFQMSKARRKQVHLMCFYTLLKINFNRFNWFPFLVTVCTS